MVRNVGSSWIFSSSDFHQLCCLTPLCLRFPQFLTGLLRITLVKIEPQSSGWRAGSGVSLWKTPQELGEAEPSGSYASACLPAPLLCGLAWPTNSTIGQSWRKPLKPINKIKIGHNGNNRLLFPAKINVMGTNCLSS